MGFAVCLVCAHHVTMYLPCTHHTLNMLTIYALLLTIYSLSSYSAPTVHGRRKAKEDEEEKRRSRRPP